MAPLRAVLFAVAALAAVGIALGLAFAGSEARLAEGVHIAGVAVGGLTTAEARGQLESRFAELAGVPVEFVAVDQTFELTRAQLGIEVDWDAAIAAAREEDSGFAPVRGFRRLETRLFGADYSPPVAVSDRVLAYALDQIAADVEQPAREAALRLDGLEPVVVPASTGRRLDRAAAEEVVVRALASFSRSPVGLPIAVAEPTVTRAHLRPALRDARLALSAPVRLALGKTTWVVKPRRLAEMLVLPANGSTELAVDGGPFFDTLAERVARAPVDAGFAVSGEAVRVVPGVEGRGLEQDATEDALLAAATSQARRVGAVSVVTVEPERTTAEAKAMGITSQLTAYSTAYAGSADRINNLQLAVSLLDGTLVAPGADFSLNDAVGERTTERGFRVAPVIIGNEYEEDVGGGTSQVATTIFNAAWEAGLKITERNPHALYIGRYPLGRDATVNYPDLDLRFRNDTEKWILVKGWSTDSGITIALYGAPTGRRVESTVGPLVVRGSPPVERIKDPTLAKGKREVEDEGVPPSTVTATRTVYLENGGVLYQETWTTNYRGENRIVRIGTKEPKKKNEEKAKEPTEQP